MNTMKSKIPFLGTILTLSPLSVFAAGPTLASLINLIIYYLNIFLVLMMGVAVVVFVYFIIKYFILPNADRSEAGSYVLYSVIGFFVILSFWGIVNILQNTFGLQNDRNRPASWASFSSLFPGSRSGSSFDGSGFMGSGSSIQRSGSDTQSDFDNYSIPNNNVGTQNDPEAGLRAPADINANKVQNQNDPEAGLRQ